MIKSDFKNEQNSILNLKYTEASREYKVRREDTFNNDKHHYYKDYDQWDLYNSNSKSTASLKYTQVAKIPKKSHKSAVSIALNDTHENQEVFESDSLVQRSLFVPIS